MSKKIIALEQLERFKEDLEEKNIKDISEQEIADQSVLAGIYNNCPQILRVSTIHDGLQFYRLQNDYRTEYNKLYYSCLLFGALIEFDIIKSGNTYSTDVVYYGLTPENNN